MLCNTCATCMHCCSVVISKCQICGKEVYSGNAPPVNELCEECSEKHGLCKQCGRVCDEEGYENV